MSDDLTRQLCEELNSIPLLDAHTHLVGGKLGAMGLHDILLYHMVVSDLKAAGCPSPGRPQSCLGASLRSHLRPCAQCAPQQMRNHETFHRHRAHGDQPHEPVRFGPEQQWRHAEA